MDKACKTLGRPIRIMEVCGTHTASIFRNSIHQSVPQQIRILTGPGCSVCVIDPGYLKILYELVNRNDVIIVARAELMKVPLNNNRDKLNDFKNAEMVGSILDALAKARVNPDKKIVFAGIGYQTSIPGHAVGLEIAEKEGLKNFFVLGCYKRIEKVMQHLLDRDNMKIDGFMTCGNMTAITGMEIYQPIMDKNVPCVPIGFEPMQLIEGVAEIARQIGNAAAQQCYDFSVGVSYKGNIIAQQYIDKFFQETDVYWRGIGMIQNSGLKLKKHHKHFDAFTAFGLDDKPIPDTSGCRCGEIITGLIQPRNCNMYMTDCIPDNPNGPCMASGEGACYITQRYSRKNRA